MRPGDSVSGPSFLSRAAPGSRSRLEEAQLRRLRGVVDIGNEAVLLGEAAQTLPRLEDLRLVVLDVLVRARPVPEARQLRDVADGHPRRATGHVVGDLVAGLHRPAAPRGQLVGGRRRPEAGRDALAIDFE